MHHVGAVNGATECGFEVGVAAQAAACVGENVNAEALLTQSYGGGGGDGLTRGGEEIDVDTRGSLGLCGIEHGNRGATGARVELGDDVEGSHGRFQRRRGRLLLGWANDECAGRGAV